MKNSISSFRAWYPRTIPKCAFSRPYIFTRKSSIATSSYSSKDLSFNEHGESLVQPEVFPSYVRNQVAGP